MAKAAGVSIATVSRTFSNPALVSGKVRQRVEDAARSLDFQVRSRNRIPRSAGTAKRIGFLLPEQFNQLDESITEQFWKGAHQVLSEHGYELATDYVDPSRDWNSDPPRSITDPTVQGFLLRPIPDRPLIQAICRHRKVVFLGNAHADMDVTIAGSDDFAGMRLLLNYLYELGHRRIAFASPPTCALIYLRRLHAYRLFLAEKDLPFDERLVKVVPHPHSWWVNPDDTARISQQFLQELLGLEKRPTAIACATDTLAAGLLAAAHERGVKVPDNLSITGFGNRLHSVVLHPPLTTVHVDQKAIGTLAAALLLRLLAGDTASSQALVRPHLIERRSCRNVNVDS